MKLMFVSLGCDKNLVDTETMLGLLNEKGFEFTDDETKAQVIIINTCCFINDAKKESIDAILEMAEYKKKGSCKALLVTGCLAQRYQEEIQKEIPEIDAVLGTTNYDEICDAVEQALSGNGSMRIGDVNALPLVRSRRVIATGGYFAYLKIAEGCSKHCTYCIIPKIRGAYRSVPMEFLVEQARQLAEDGVKELILVAQETTVYGTDLYKEKRLPDLLRRLCEIKELRWIRIMYCYPEEITPELIRVMKEEKKICHYLDLPIQHANDEILKRMGRKMTKKQLVELIQNLRREIPDICLRTTLIAGFPGETKEQHEEMMEFVDTMEFDRLGVFAYSAEENTAAALMSGQIDEETKEQWRDELMELQQEVSCDLSEKLIGEELDVIVEGKASGENVYVSRSYKDAPDVDGYVFFYADDELMSGDMAKVKITGALEYDLTGVLIE